MMSRRFTILLASAIALAPQLAEAQERAHAIANPPVDETAPEPHLPPKTSRERKPVSIGLLLGYGVTLDDGGGAVRRKGGNGFGIGFGAAGGYDLAPFYLGARFMFFLGGAEHVGDVVVSRKEATLGLEAGIPITFARLTLRPQAGFGLAIESAEREREGEGGAVLTGDDSSEDVYVAPGLAALYALDDSVFIGVDSQVPLIIRDRTLIGLTVLGSAGMRF